MRLMLHVCANDRYPGLQSLNILKNIHGPINKKFLTLKVTQLLVDKKPIGLTKMYLRYFLNVEQESHDGSGVAHLSLLHRESKI